MGDEHLSKDYDWRRFRAKSDRAYKTGVGVGNHALQKGGECEIGFALDLAQTFLNSSPTDKALDVACGMGYMTACLDRMGFDTQGIDISPEGIESAKTNYPDLDFKCCDAAHPKDNLTNQYDLIFVREFHPFKVIDDLAFHNRLIDDYLSLLNPSGLLVIAHAKPGVMSYGGERREYKGVDFSMLSERFDTAGPFYYFAFNHLGLRPKNQILTRLLSWITGLVANTFGCSWIEYFVIKGTKSPP